MRNALVRLSRSDSPSSLDITRLDPWGRIPPGSRVAAPGSFSGLSRWSRQPTRRCRLFWGCWQKGKGKGGPVIRKGDLVSAEFCECRFIRVQPRPPRDVSPLGIKKPGKAPKILKGRLVSVLNSARKPGKTRNDRAGAGRVAEGDAVDQLPAIPPRSRFTRLEPHGAVNHVNGF